MDKIDKSKLKVLIKMILIQRSPDSLTSNQISQIINSYEWGFQTSISSAKIGKLLGYELSKKNGHFMSDIGTFKRSGVNVYKYMGD